MGYFFISDGSIKNKKSKSGYSNTQGFTIQKGNLLCKILNTKLNLVAKPVKKKNKYPISI